MSNMSFNGLGFCFPRAVQTDERASTRTDASAIFLHEIYHIYIYKYRSITERKALAVTWSPDLSLGRYPCGEATTPHFPTQRALTQPRPDG